MAKSLLIDVRSVEEYESGFLPGAINIEYISISELATIKPDISQEDNITLYCRSGRRSAIALGTLQGLGYKNVRDIGSYEDAERTLEREAMGRKTALPEKMMNAAADKESLEKSTRKLLDGLRELE